MSKRSILDDLSESAKWSGSTTVGIDVENYREIVDDLIGELPTTANSILKRALNATARRVGRELSEKAQDRYQIKKIKFSRQVTTHYASDKNLAAKIVARGEPLAASYFKISPTKPDTPTMSGSKPVKIAILKESHLQTVQHPGTGLTAFLTQFASGHVAVVQRKPPGKYTSKGWKARKKKHGNFKNATGKLDDTRLRQFFGPSVSKMLEKEGITEGYIDENQERIRGYLEDYILTFLNRELHFANKSK